MSRFLLALLFSTTILSPLFAIEEKFTDKRVDDKTENNSEFKLDGIFFIGYERTDSESNGVPDANGTNARNQGFDVRRAYLNARGDVVDGPYKGFGYRFTIDGGQVLGGTAATTAASGNNIHVPELKFAYFTVPLYSTGFGTGILRFGMQHIPIVDGQAGGSAEYYWGHRYIDSTAFESVSFSSSADMGVAYAHKWDYAGLHVMLGNGEGFRKLNGQNVAAQQTFSTIAANAASVRSNLRTLSQGSGDSYGLDLYGNLSVKPTGKNKDLEFAIMLPFRLANTTGIRHEEVNVTGVTLQTVNPALMTYTTDKRSKQDVTLGAEGAFSTTLGDFKITLGGGQAVYKDKRATSFAFDQTATAVIGNDYTRFINPDQDAIGRANYGYIHAKFRWVGVFYRDTYGTGSSGSLSGLPSKSYLQQLVEADMTDSIPGNVSTAIARGTSPGVDLGKARFRKQLGGIEFFPMSRLSIAIGMSRQTATNGDGARQKVSPYAQVPATGTTTIPPNSTAETQLNTILQAQMGIPNQLVSTDMGGKLKENRQYFVRASYEY